MTLKNFVGVKPADAYTELNSKLSEDLLYYKAAYKSPIMKKVFAAVDSGKIRLVYSNTPAFDPPSFFPYVISPEADYIALNCTQMVKESVGNDGSKEFSFHKSMEDRLITGLFSAYASLVILTKEYIMTTGTATIGADIWSTIFINTLQKMVALDGDMGKVAAFKYFAAKFFMIYYLGLSVETANKGAASIVAGGKPDDVGKMEARMERLKLDPYSGFFAFCDTMFNNEVSNIQGFKYGGDLNSITFIYEYIKRYDASSLVLLLGIHYFFYAMVDQYKQSRIFTSRALTDLIAARKNSKIHNFVTDIEKG
jgi:hypothetical protein